MHYAFLTVDGTKMSKSLGNFYTVGDVLDKNINPLALRYLYLGAHYKKPMNFTWASLEASQKGLSRLQKTVKALKESERTILSSEKNEKILEFRNKFNESLNDDLNTSKAMAVMFEMLKSSIPSEDKYDLAISFDEVLGLNLR